MAIYLRRRHLKLGGAGPPRSLILDRDKEISQGLVGLFDLSYGHNFVPDLTKRWFQSFDNSSGDLSYINTEYGGATNFGPNSTQNDRILLDEGNSGTDGPHFGGKTGNFSIAWLAQIADGAARTNVRIYDRNSASNSANGHGLWFPNDVNNNLRWVMNLDAGAPDASLSSDNDFYEDSTGGDVRFGVVTITTIGTTGQFYRDGVPWGTTWDVTGGTTLDNTNQPISIGNWSHDAATDRQWEGWIKYVAFFDRVLSPAEAYGLWQPSTRWDWWWVKKRHISLPAVAAGTKTFTAQQDRLGAYGGPRQIYGAFAPKAEAGLLKGRVTRLGMYGGPRQVYGPMTRTEIIAGPGDDGKEDFRGFIANVGRLMRH